MEKSGNDRITGMDDFFRCQLNQWPLAKKNYDDLDRVLIRDVAMPGNSLVRVQFNPARMRSSAARVDKKSISERPCFLCAGNLPPEQKKIMFGDSYMVLVNPFPIFRRHLTIALTGHKDQLIRGRFVDMLTLARALEDYTLFYNGPRCGASAPDHFHFQAGIRGFMPVEKEARTLPRKRIKKEGAVVIDALEGCHRKTLVMEGDSPGELDRWFTKIYDILQDMQPGENEPMLNILAGYYGGIWRVVVFPRERHRPWQFEAEGEKQILLSPASVDFGGVWITPRQEDYEKIDQAVISDIFSQVSLGEAAWAQLPERLG
ncbi:MAG: DUF4922 domain-containing protein [Marinilabiliales bacterium]|nr:MAG: DUF4922 domain-containing protein [Marinilabiliales bacterium]